MIIPELTPQEFKEIAAFFKKLAVEQGYETLTKKGPKGFSKNFDIAKLVNVLLKHFESTEDYEKCSELLAIGDKHKAEKLIDDIINKG